MNLTTIPLRYSRRKWGRTLLLLFVFSLGVMSIVGLTYVSKVVGHSMEKKLITYGANILVAPKVETMTVSYGGFAMGDMLFDIQYLEEDKAIKAIRSIELSERISTIAPKLITTATFDSITTGIVGVRWDEEINIKSFWSVTGKYPEGPDQVLLGSNVAQKLGFKAKDTIRFMGQEFSISGILGPTGGEDDNVILVDIGRLQQLTGQENKVNFVEVAALCAGCPIEDIVAQIQNALPDTKINALQNVVEQRMYSVRFVKKLILSVSIVILLTACTMVGLSLLSSVNERKREIGILRSMGYSKANIFSIFCFEAFVIGIISGMAGYVAGFALSRKVLAMLDALEQGLLVFNPLHLAATCLLIGLVSISSAFLPAWKASGIEPSEALITL